MKQLSDRVFVGPQIQVSDIAALVAQGIKTVINNRPDGEMPHQPTGADIKQAAEEAGLTYVELPMAGGVSPDLVAQSMVAYSEAQGPVFAYCASGTRSSVLWCFAHVKEMGVDAVLECAAEAGYNLPQLRAPLSQFAES